VTLMERAIARILVEAEAAQRLERSGAAATTADIERDWETWVRTLFPQYVSTSDGVPIAFAAFHRAFWDWVWALQRGERPAPFVAIWPRGAGKSTNAELATVAIGARGIRRYAWYISATQEKADDHVQNIAAMLESAAVEHYYPAMAERLLSKYGTSRGWRRNRLRTASGFTVDALGLDSAARGAKLEEVRPDFMILDDIDSETDTPTAVEKRIKVITRKLLPAGAQDLAVLAVQNLIHPDSVFSRLADGRAEFLTDRMVSGPYPAVEGLQVEQRDGRYVITGGRPTWEWLSLERCQAMLDDFGLSAFLSECQHDVEPPAGGLFSHLDLDAILVDPDEVPALEQVQVWCDPAVTSSDQADAHGVQVDGRGVDGRLYRLFSWEQRATPETTIKLAIEKALEYQATLIGFETDQGGELWETTYRKIWQEVSPGKPMLRFREEKAGSQPGNKVHRWSQMLADYERDRIRHVRGTHTVLHRALRRVPLTKPFDLVDAAYWSWHSLMEQPPAIDTGVVPPPLVRRTFGEHTGGGFSRLRL